MADKNMEQVMEKAIIEKLNAIDAQETPEEDAGIEEVKKLAKYKVQDVKEEDGVYTVSVQVEPSNVFQTLQQSSTEVSKDKMIFESPEMLKW